MSEDVTRLVHELLPTAPEIGLFVEPNIPGERLRGALEDYATTMQAGEVLALYDATYKGNGKDGALFASDRLVFQNHDWAAVQEIRYDEIVQVSMKKKFIGGRKVYVEANPGRATVTFVIDFSGKPKAADYVARFLQEVMMVTMDLPDEDESGHNSTDVAAVGRALIQLHDDGLLSDSDLSAMMSVIKK